MEVCGRFWTGTRGRSYEGEVLVLTQSVRVLVLLEQLRQTLQVDAVETLDVLRTGAGGLQDRDGPPHWNRTRESRVSTKVLVLTGSNGFYCIVRVLQRFQRTDGVDGLPVGYESEAVLEHSSGVEQRSGDSKDALQAVLWTQNQTSHNTNTGPNLRFWAGNGTQV